MKKINGLLAAAAVMLVLSAAIGSAWGYFTTFVEVRGGHTLRLGSETEIEEDFSDWTKHVSITSRPDSVPVYIRAKAFSGSGYDLIYSDAAGKWTLGEDDYYYYSDILYGGQTAEELLVKIEGVPKDVMDSESFNVVVVYESTPVLYREDGTPYADWNAVLDTGNAEGGDGR